MASTRAGQDRKNATVRRVYAERKAIGLCVRCCGPVCSDSTAYCGIHLVQMRKRVKRILLGRMCGPEQPQPTGSKS